jgi:hypothetical protein
MKDYAVADSVSRPERRRARADESRRADLAEAARLGAEFGLGDNAEVARVRVPRTPFWLRQTIIWLLSCLVVGFGLTVAAAAESAWPGDLIAGLLTFGGGLAVWLLGRYGRSLVVWHRIYRYPEGIIQLISSEPEPRALRWAKVDTVTLVFYYPDDGPTRLVWCQLAGGGTTIDVGGASGLRYPPRVIRDVARDAERKLAPRIAGSLISSYETGEPVLAGTWRIDRAGVTENQNKAEKSRLIPWGDVRSITVSNRSYRGGVDPPNGITLIVPWGERQQRALSHNLSLSNIPNGMFLPHLFEHIADYGGFPLHKGSWPTPPPPKSPDR